MYALKICCVLVFVISAAANVLGYWRVVPTTTRTTTARVPQQCNFHCARTDEPICATNGECMRRFRSECVMSAYNCKHPQKPYVIIPHKKCNRYGAPLCKNELDKD